MHLSFAGGVMLTGIALMLFAQVATALHAFTGNPFKGLLCLAIPLYVYVYARKSDVPVWFMRAWYIGIAVWVVGAVVAS